MTENQMEEIARGNVERHLADCAEEDGADAVFDSAYTLGFDALVDAGVPQATARRVAQYVAQCYAQP